MVMAHFAFWFLFAGIWLAVASSYQDDIGDGKEHCITGTQSFAGLLMMSVETQVRFFLWDSNIHDVVSN